MPADDFSGAVPSATYHGFSGPRHRVSSGEKRRRTITVIGVGAALVLGLAVGMLARPKLALGSQAPMEAVVQSAGPQLAIQVDRPAPPAAPAATSERLEVLPARLARAAPRPPVVQAEITEAEPERALAPIDCAAPVNGYEARICYEAGLDDSAPAETQLYGYEDD